MHRRTPVDSGAWFALVIGATLFSVVLGYLVYAGWALPLMGAAICVTAMSVLVRFPAVGLGIWVLAITNTLPGINLDSLHIPGVFSASDALVLLLVLAAGITVVRSRSVRSWSRLPRWLTLVAISLVLWWILVLFRTWLFEGVPLRFGFLFGRDLLYGALASVSALLLLRNKRDVRVAIQTMFVGGAIYAAAFVPYVLLGLDVGGIVHPYLLGTVGGYVRVYQASNDFIVLLLQLTLWLAASSRSTTRPLYWGATILFAVQVALQQTRANYAGLLVGLACASIFAWFLPDRSQWLRRRIVLMSALMGAGILVLALSLTVNPGSSYAPVRGNTFFERAASIPRELTASGLGPSDNWSYRLTLARTYQRVLGASWPWGLGFLHPSVHFVEGLPNGNIRFSDLGALGVVMTIGIIGAGLLFAIPVGAVWALGRASWREGARPTERALSVGFAGLLSGALASSVTLGYFAIGVGPAMSGVFVACAITLSRSQVESGPPA